MMREESEIGMLVLCLAAEIMEEKEIKRISLCYIYNSTRVVSLQSF
jgi:hypothetical protein